MQTLEFHCKHTSYTSKQYLTYTNSCVLLLPSTAVQNEITSIIQKQLASKKHAGAHSCKKEVVATETEAADLEGGLPSKSSEEFLQLLVTAHLLQLVTPGSQAPPFMLRHVHLRFSHHCHFRTSGGKKNKTKQNKTRTHTSLE